MKVWKSQMKKGIEHSETLTAAKLEKRRKEMERVLAVKE